MLDRFARVGGKEAHARKGGFDFLVDAIGSSVGAYLVYHTIEHQHLAVEIVEGAQPEVTTS
jgi:hypothetical protein